MYHIPLVLYCFLLRLLELFYSRKNIKLLQKREFKLTDDEILYRCMVFVHTGLLLGCLIEPFFIQRQVSRSVIVIFSIIFTLSQILRFWTLKSLGQHWNVRVMSKTGYAEFITAGPYRYIRHPNYLVVMVEFFSLPIICSAYYTGIIFVILNIVVLYFRITKEESQLSNRAGYNEVMKRKCRFLPGIF
jgi:methyltransferase